MTEVRAASFTMAYEVFDETTDGDAGSTCRATSRADAVRVRRGAAAPDHPRGARGARAVPGAGPASPRVRAEPVEGRGTVYDVHVRFSDVDVYGHVNNVKYFEYFQEARIASCCSLPRGRDGAWPRPGGRAHRRRLPAADPVPARAVRRGPGCRRVGTTSSSSVGEIRDGERCSPAAAVVMVTFDTETQRAADDEPSASASGRSEQARLEVTPRTCSP